MQNDNQAAALFWKAQPPFVLHFGAAYGTIRKTPPGGLTLNNE